jgi:hypothetical protein
MGEVGMMMLACTLDPHEGNEHYDDAFCTEWKDIEQADS